MSKNNGTVELDVVMVNNDSVIELDEIISNWKESDGWGLNYTCQCYNLFNFNDVTKGLIEEIMLIRIIVYSCLACLGN